MDESALRDVARLTADKFMSDAFPISMRLGSGFNNGLDMWNRGLDPELYPSSLSITVNGQGQTTYLETRLEPRIPPSIQDMRGRLLSPEQAVLNQQSLVTNAMTTLYVRGVIKTASSTTRTQQMKVEIEIPAMSGSVYALSDMDGLSGIFAQRGKEHYFQHAFIDAPNMVSFCPSSASPLTGRCRVVAPLRHLREPACMQCKGEGDLDINRVTFGVHQLTISPREGIFVHQVEASSRNAPPNWRLVPLLVYIDALRNLSRRQVERHVHDEDVHALFSGMDALLRMIEEADEDRAAAFRGELQGLRARLMRELREARHLEKVTKAVESMQSRNGRGQSHRDAQRAFMPCADLHPEEGLGHFDMVNTKLWSVKQMIFQGLATMGGLMPPTDAQDLRTKRVRTAEMYIALRVRRYVLSKLHKGLQAQEHSLDYIVDNVVRDFHTTTTKNVPSALTVDPTANAIASSSGVAQQGADNGQSDPSRVMMYAFDCAPDNRRCFSNLLQKLFMVQNTYNQGQDPLKRVVHPSHIGRVCCSDTPTTADIGLRHSPCVGTMVSHDVSPLLLLSKIQQLLEDHPTHTNHPVYINGVLCAWTAHARNLIQLVRNIRRAPVTATHAIMNKVWHFCAIGVNTEKVMLCLPDDVGGLAFREGVHIRTDAGRFFRPLFNVEALLKCNRDAIRDAAFFDLVERGVVEFVDTNEELSQADVRLASSAWKPGLARYTHCELHPCLLRGMLTSLIPFASCNHDVKNTNECNHLKAQMHINTLGYAQRLDTQSHLAWNLQFPLTRTPGFDWLEMGYRPHGANVLFAICTNAGYNQEDAVVLNRSLVERGGFFGIAARSIHSKNKSVKRSDIEVGGMIRPDQVIFESADPTSKRDSVCSGLQESGQVCFEARKGANEVVGIRFAKSEVAQVGDKFCTSHSQKGTVGRLVPDHDMPYTLQGLTPDVILNPHAIPSRLTVGQIAELLHATCAAHRGKPTREFGFDETSHEEVEAMLGEHTADCGLHTFIDPHTGQRVSCKLFMGMCYYSRLKHIVDDKVRQMGVIGAEISTSNRQPETGRRYNGGIKLSEMERWALSAHGASGVMKERFTMLTDAMNVLVDPRSRAVVSDVQMCGADVHEMPTNYSHMMIQHVMNSMFVDMRYDTA